MIAYVHGTPVSGLAAIGAESLAEFAQLSRLHRDGWGTAWTDPLEAAVLTDGSASADEPAVLIERISPPAAMRIVYLRFASRGAPPAPENIQPLSRDGVAFAHNGLIARDELLGLLTPAERQALRGTTDSEVYFALVHRALAPASPDCTPDVAATTRRIAAAVGVVRARFPASCLNAMLLTPSALYVIHSAGTAAPPLPAFAARGFDLDALPPGHDGDYNTLWTTVMPSGARVVATTGVDVTGWAALPADSVTALAGGEIAHVAIPA